MALLAYFSQGYVKPLDLYKMTLIFILVLNMWRYLLYWRHV